MDGGYIRFHRKARKAWQWEKASWWKAWSWLMTEANYADDLPVVGLKRGQLRFCASMVTEEWEMTHYQVIRFMRKAEKAGDILWTRGTGGRPRGTLTVAPATVLATVSATVSATVFSLVTLVNFDTYNPVNGNAATVSATGKTTVSATSKKEEEKNKKRKELSPSASASDDRPAKNQAAKPKKETDPRIKRVIDYYSERHSEVHGFKPQIFGAKDATLIRHVLTTCGSEDEVMARIDRFLEDDFSWMDRPSWEISSFHKRINKYAMAAKPGGDSIWGNR